MPEDECWWMLPDIFFGASHPSPTAKTFEKLLKYCFPLNVRDNMPRKTRHRRRRSVDSQKKNSTFSDTKDLLTIWPPPGAIPSDWRRKPPTNKWRIHLVSHHQGKLRIIRAGFGCCGVVDVHRVVVYFKTVPRYCWYLCMLLVVVRVIGLVVLYV